MFAVSNKYKISIITVVYNGAKTIEQTIKSVLEQSYKNIEYIIVDGQSTDGTQQIVMKYIDSIACFVSEEDAGIYDAMNKGIEYATGDYVIFINCDDRLTENSLEQCVDYLDDTVDILYGDTYRILEDGREYRVEGELKDSGDIVYRGICHQAVLAKTKLLKENYFNTGYEIASDYDWLLEMFYKGAKFVYVPIAFSYYGTTGYSAVNSGLCARECYEIAKKYLGGLDKQDQVKYSSIINELYYIYLIEDMCVTADGCELIKNILKEILIPQEKVLMFGRGNNAEICLKVLKIVEADILKIIDNDKDLQGTFYQGIEVVGVNQIIDKKMKVVVSSVKYGKEICNQLVENDFTDIVLFSDIKTRICQRVKTVEVNGK